MIQLCCRQLRERTFLINMSDELSALSRKACCAHYHCSLALTGLLRRRPLPDLPGTPQHNARRVERRHELLGTIEVRGHPLRFGPPTDLLVDEGHHDPGSHPA